MGLKCVVLGATSEIAQATLRQFESPSEFILLGRSTEKLEQIVDDLIARGHKAQLKIVDSSWENEQPEEVWKECVQQLNYIDICYVAQGYLPQQEEQLKIEEFEKTLDVNFISIVKFLTSTLNDFKNWKRGQIVVLTSVAGIRGRQSAMSYGCAKAAMIHWLSGLRMQLEPDGINVLDVRPGPVVTPMTEKLKKGLLFVESHVVGKQIYKAITQKKDIIYTPKWWRYIFLCISIVPETLFKKLKM